MTLFSPAELLLRELGVTEPGEIDLEAVAWHVGATVRCRLLDGCEAHILGLEDRAVITINCRSSRRRRRFSLGHELGHWRHHRGRSVCLADDIANRRRGPLDPERVADGYAADLLMPRYLFAPQAARYPRMTLDPARELAAAFNVSLTAAAIRFVELGPAPAMLVCHELTGRKWFASGRDVPDRLFPRRGLDQASFAFDVLFGNKDEPRPRLVGADAWFDRWNADRFELYEHTVRIGDGEILTMLSWMDDAMLEDAA